MKIFVSSRFSGMEAFRQVACTAICDLRHDPITVETFTARSQSPQQACLEGVRQSGLVVLLLGESYGAAQQPSGLSATHEEFREARETRDVLAFLQGKIAPEPAQQAFIQEVSGWTGGTLRGSFRDTEDLRSQITGAIAHWQLAKVAGPVDQNTLVAKAKELIPVESRNVSRPGGPRLVLAIASGPSQPILRPVEIESSVLRQHIQQTALFGPRRIMTTDRGSSFQLEGAALRLRQEDRSDLLLEPEGNIRLRLTLPERNWRSMAIGLVEEDVKSVLMSALAYAASLLDRIDPTGRLTHLAQR